MSSHKRRIGELQDDDIWKQNEVTLRRLYLIERKTLRDLKKIMENEHNFPITTLSTYESKLRDLGVRKKMRQQDWRPVYQHYVNSGERHTAVFFNGTRIPWDKAWKEIRRSGARECNDGHIYELPTDVVMRSPSPSPVSRSTAPSDRVPIPWHLRDVSLGALSPTAVLHRLKLFDIPSNLLRSNMIDLFRQSAIRTHPGRIKVDEENSDHNSVRHSAKMVEYTSHHHISASLHQGSKDADIDRLSIALYRLANSYVTEIWPGEALDEALEVIINRTPKNILIKLLESDSPTIRVATNTLAKVLSQLNRKDDFFSLVDVICRIHPNWIKHEEYLRYSGILGCANSCQLLLQTWRRPKCLSKGNLFEDNYVAAVLDSIAREHIECAKILAGHVFKPSAAHLQPEKILRPKIFWGFLYTVAEGSYRLSRLPGYNEVPFELRTPAVSEMLKWFLESGAEIDIPAGVANSPRFVQYLPGHSKQPYYTMYTPRNWMPTGLDYVYFQNSELYAYLAKYSTRITMEVTRSGSHHSASQGTESLRTYLLCRSSHTPDEQNRFLDILLIEEFLRIEVKEHANFNVINTLLEYNLGLQKFRLKLNESVMLYYAIKAANEQGMHPTINTIVRTLIHIGAFILPETIDKAVEAEGTTLLNLLQLCGANFKSHGTMALCTALKLNNYDAVDQLLDAEVDIDATLWECGQEITVLARANTGDELRPKAPVFGHEVRVFPSRLDSLMGRQMLEYLISRNVQLRANPANRDIRHLLYTVIKHGLANGDWNETFDKVRVLLDAEPLTNNQQRIDPYLLEACFSIADYGTEPTIRQRLFLMNYLLDHGVSGSRGGVLAVLIYNNTPEDEVLKLLDKGADVNAYTGKNPKYRSFPFQYTPLQAAAAVGSFGWVKTLIQRGADLNKPAKGEYGRTVLQAACGSERPNIDMIEFLINNGADINAPPASVEGVTALQAAVQTGDFEVILLLLQHGAEINAAPSAAYGYCALDASVYNNRVDIVQFLLNLGALSYDKGESGYKGAIRLAKERDNLTIVDMIQQYALKNGKRGEELFANDEQSGDYSSESGDDSDDTDEVGGTWLENQDDWEE
ncbi:hypothetical protein F4803DRAFT_557416 [Xylaria telfairii]|nr:hypothetical protein F4803DRAFT_557416 [Xylaria telfairii]